MHTLILVKLCLWECMPKHTHFNPTTQEDPDGESHTLLLMFSSTRSPLNFSFSSSPFHICFFSYPVLSLSLLSILSSKIALRLSLSTSSDSLSSLPLYRPSIVHIPSPQACWVINLFVWPRRLMGKLCAIFSGSERQSKRVKVYRWKWGHWFFLDVWSMFCRADGDRV